VLLLLIKTLISVAESLAGLEIVLWILCFKILIRTKNLSWGLGLVDSINFNFKPDIYLMWAKFGAWVVEGYGSWGWSQDRSLSWLHTYILDCFLALFFSYWCMNV
jgi:hypothetical protein